MKTAFLMSLSSIALFVVSPLAFGAATYHCTNQSQNSFSLVVNSDGNIQSLAENDIHINGLHVASFGTETSKTTIYEGNYVPHGMNVLAFIQVTVDNSLLKGSSAGMIRAAYIAGGEATEYSCEIK